MAALLELRGIEKRYRDTYAVQGLDVTVPPGCIYGFLGPNGAGKTTTIRIAMNIIRPDNGLVSILGHDSASKVKHRIGYMPEERGLYRKMRVRHLLKYVGAVKGIRRTTLKMLVPQLLERVGLDAAANKRVEELSRGMHQKLQFLTTIINDPDLLILDEPFSGLDPVNLELLKAIMMEKRREGKTVLFSTHMMEQAELICDSILLINGGKKVLDGATRSIRQQHQSGVVRLEAEGDTAFIAQLPMVLDVHRHEQGELDITLRQDASPQDLLAALIGRAAVRRFEVKTPNLREIFVQLVGTKHA